MAEQLTAEQRTLMARVAAHASWAATADRTARTSRARAAFMARFEDQVDPDRTMTDKARAQAAESARKAYFARMAYLSSRARRKSNTQGNGDSREKEEAPPNWGDAPR
jgi:hypothetical protein